MTFVFFGVFFKLLNSIKSLKIRKQFLTVLSWGIFCYPSFMFMLSLLDVIIKHILWTTVKGLEFVFVFCFLSKQETHSVAATHRISHYTGSRHRSNIHWILVNSMEGGGGWSECVNPKQSNDYSIDSFSPNVNILIKYFGF